MTAKSNRTAAPASPANNSARPEIIETLPATFFGPPGSDKQLFVGFYSVSRDETESTILGEIYESEKATTELFNEARHFKDLRTVKRCSRAIVDAQKSMFAHIKNLDRHRRGSTQNIVVNYGSPPTVNSPQHVEDCYSKSDALIDEICLHRAESLLSFADMCRKQAKKLDDIEARDLIGVIDGFRIGPDRRTWKVEYIRLANVLSGHATKMAMAIKRRGSKNVQNINVQYTGDVPDKKKAEIGRKFGKEKEVRPKFAIAKNVMKASVGIE